MKVCFPVQQDEGLASSVYSHFGSAPLFIVVDTDTNEASAIANQDQHHGDRGCDQTLHDHRHIAKRIGHDRP